LLRIREKEQKGECQRKGVLGINSHEGRQKKRCATSFVINQENAKLYFFKPPQGGDDSIKK